MKYDVLISYRREDPDKQFARDLLKTLEADGYKVAIDERDFDPAQTFLEEMERCIKESRFTLAVMSPRYLQSGNSKAGLARCPDCELFGSACDGAAPRPEPQVPKGVIFA